MEDTWVVKSRLTKPDISFFWTLPVSLSLLEFLVRIRLQIVAGDMLQETAQNSARSTLQRKLLLGSASKKSRSDGDGETSDGDDPSTSSPSHTSENGLSDAAQQSFLRGT